MELLVANKIINLNLSVRDVYKKVWLRTISSFHSSLQFDRFDLEQISEQEFHLNCFTDICQQHLEKKHSPISTKAFVDLLNRQDGGLIDQAIHYIQLHSPPVKTYLGMQDRDARRGFRCSAVKTFKKNRSGQAEDSLYRPKGTAVEYDHVMTYRLSFFRSLKEPIRTGDKGQNTFRFSIDRRA